MLQYNPQHVSNSTLLIFRRTNCIITASGIITLEISERSSVNGRTVYWLRVAYCVAVYGGSFTYFQSDDTRCCNNKICPPEDEQGTARNMLRIIM